MTTLDTQPASDRGQDSAAELATLGTITVTFAGLIGALACAGFGDLGTLGAIALLAMWTAGIAAQFYAAIRLREANDEDKVTS